MIERHAPLFSVNDRYTRLIRDKNLVWQDGGEGNWGNKVGVIIGCNKSCLPTMPRKQRAFYL